MARRGSISVLQGLHLLRLAVLEKENWVTRTLLGRFQVVCPMRCNPYQLNFGTQWLLYQTAEIGQLSLMENWIMFLFLFLLFAFRCSLWVLLPMLSETWINMASRACGRDARPLTFSFFGLDLLFL